MQSRSEIVLDAVLRAIRPLARLLLRHGVGYPAFATALKQVFLSAAMDELQRTGRKQTDSAISLLSGVHRRDVRTLARLEVANTSLQRPMNLATEVVSRWLSEPKYVDAQGKPRVLPKSGVNSSFESLAASVSSDVRPRAILDEMVRLGAVREDADRVELVAAGFAPRQGFREMASLFSDNLGDHAAAAALNMDAEHNYLDQAVFSDGLTHESVKHLRQASADAWRKALAPVLREIHARYEHDKATASEDERTHRFRFGAYYFSCDDHDQPS